MQIRSSLLAISPVDGRYAPQCDALRNVTSEFGLIRYRTLVEVRWLEFLAGRPEIEEVPALGSESAELLRRVVDEFSLADAERIKELERRTNHDVKAIEYFLKEKLEADPELAKVTEFTHFACTSEDINSTAYALMLRDACFAHWKPRAERILNILQQAVLQYADQPMLARTHGQPASPTTVGKEFAVFAERYRLAIEGAARVKPRAKMSGATGNYNAHLAAYPHVDWAQLSGQFLAELGVDQNPFTTQIEPHDWISELFDAIARSNTILVGFCRDVWGYISLGFFKQRLVQGEIGSSTMPHKVNPIDFENAEGNLGIANAVFDHLSRKLTISRWQRDLTDSTALRNVGVGFAHTLVALHSIERGISKLELDANRLAADLDQNWEVLGEAIQTVMRRYHVPNAYELLKEFTRGKKVDAAAVRVFVESLPIPSAEIERLCAMTPASYTGLASAIARGAGRSGTSEAGGEA